MREAFPTQKATNGEEDPPIPEYKPESREVLIARDLVLTGKMKKVLDNPKKFRGAVDEVTLKLFLMENPSREIVESLFTVRREVLSPDAITNGLVSQINVQEIGKASLHFILNSLPEFPNVDRLQFLHDLRDRALAWQEGEKVASAIESAHLSFFDGIPTEEFDNVLLQLRGKFLQKTSEQAPAQELPKNIELEFLNETQEQVARSAESTLKNASEDLKVFDIENEIALQGIKNKSIRQKITSLKERSREKAYELVANISAFTNIIAGDTPVVFGTEQESFETKRGTAEEKFEEIVARAKQEIVRKGITGEQRVAHIPVINIVLYHGVEPVTYHPLNKVKNLIPNLLIGRGESSPEREDAWRFYLGIPQENNTFNVSEYKPETNGNSDELLGEKYCYRLNNFWKIFLSRKPENEEFSNRPPVEWILHEVEKGNGTFVTRDGYTSVMGGFSFHKGSDKKGPYIEYSDVWNLNVAIEREKGFFGKPYHIYDRLYYDPETFEPISENLPE